MITGEELKKNQLVICPNCKKRHRVKNSIEKLSSTFSCKTDLLQYVKCGKDTYLVGFKGREIKN